MFWSEAEQMYLIYTRYATSKDRKTRKRAVARLTSKDFLNWTQPLAPRNEVRYACLSIAIAPRHPRPGDSASMPKVRSLSLNSKGGPHFGILRASGFEVEMAPPNVDLSQEDAVISVLQGCEASVAGSEPYSQRVVEYICWRSANRQRPLGPMSWFFGDEVDAQVLER